MKAIHKVELCPATIVILKSGGSLPMKGVGPDGTPWELNCIGELCWKWPCVSAVEGGYYP